MQRGQIRDISPCYEGWYIPYLPAETLSRATKYIKSPMLLVCVKCTLSEEPDLIVVWSGGEQKWQKRVSCTVGGGCRGKRLSRTMLIDRDRLLNRKRHSIWSVTASPCSDIKLCLNIHLFCERYPPLIFDQVYHLKNYCVLGIFYCTASFQLHLFTSTYFWLTKQSTPKSLVNIFYS